MESENRGFIVTHYTDGNGKKLTRDELGERILQRLNSGPETCGNLGRLLKIRKESLRNVLTWLWHNKMVTKKKNDRGIFEYSNIQSCALSDLFYPTPEQVEKQFNIKSRKIYRLEEGRSISYGSKGITPYQSNYLTSPLWDM